MPGPYQVFAAACNAVAPAQLPPGVTSLLWRPGLTRVIPPPVRERALVAFWAYHHARAFANRDYSAVLVLVNGRVAHRSMVYPKYFAFPFMAPEDIQVGNTLTLVEFRGRGLATFALREAARLLRCPGRNIWYVADKANVASCRVAKHAGLSLVATATRRDRLRSHLLGRYVLDKSPDEST